MKIKFWSIVFIFSIIGACAKSSSSTTLLSKKAAKKAQNTNTIANELIEDYLFGIYSYNGLNSIPFKKQYFLKNRIKKLIIKVTKNGEVFCREHHVNASGELVKIKNYWEESPLFPWEYFFKENSAKKRSYKEVITTSYSSSQYDIEYFYSNNVLEKYKIKCLNSEDTSTQELIQSTTMGKFIMVHGYNLVPQCFLYLEKPLEDEEQLSKQIELIYNQTNFSYYRRRGIDFDVILLENDKIIERLSFTYNGTKEVLAGYLTKKEFVYNNEKIAKEKQVLYTNKEVKVEKTFVYNTEDRLTTIVTTSPNIGYNTQTVIGYEDAKIKYAKKDYRTIMGEDRSYIANFEYEYYD
jgi:hypothetical protein